MKRTFNLFSLAMVLALIASLLGMPPIPAYAESTIEHIPLSLPAGWSMGHLYGVWGSSPQNVYAVGYAVDAIGNQVPLVYHNDGTGWIEASPPLAAGWGGGHLYGVWGSSASDIYAVGEGYNQNGSGPLLYHNDGTGWIEATPSLPVGWSGGSLIDVWGSSASDIYTVGWSTGPLLYHNDGTGWTEVGSSLSNGGYLNGVWGSSANDVYAVGTGTNVPVIYHNDGTGWTEASPSLPVGWSYGNLRSVWGSSASNVYTVGWGSNGPLLYHNDGTGWSEASSSLPAGGGSLYGIWGASASDVYVVGYGDNAVGDTSPLLYHNDGTAWTDASPSLPAGWSAGYLHSVWGSSAGDLYVVGEGSYVFNNGTVPLLYQRGADNLIVTNTNDSGTGSLRDAITAAASGDTIIFSPSLAGQTITLESNLIIDKDLTIDGSGLSPQVTISGGNVAYLEVISYKIVKISNLTIANGYTSGDGGAIFSYGDLTVINSTVRNNHAIGDGGAIYSAGRLTLKNSTIYQNQADSDGGALSFAGNTDAGTIVNSTVTQNQAGSGGGGISINGNVDTEIINSTFAGNNAAGGTELMLSGNGTLTLSNSILACLPGNSGCIIQSGNFAINSANSIIDAGTLAAFGLAEIGDNGGRTKTMALLAGSPLIDAGDDATCASIDQRGVARPQGAHCDIGAYEFYDGPISPGDTVRVSVDSSGAQGNGYSYHSAISADGRYTAFDSDATNLVSGDTNGTNDIFVHDTQTEITTRVSVDSNGVQGNGYSSLPSISGDGRYLAFFSSATNLVSGDTNEMSDVFLHDMQTGLTTRVSVDSGGGQITGGSSDASLSADGHRVTFVSSAANLVSGDTNGADDVFVHDMLTGMTTRVSVDSSSVQGNNYSYAPSISGDGRYIAFYSWATNLGSGDTNEAPDVFIHDLQAGITTRVSVDSNGVQGNNFSRYPSISGDGRYIAFDSVATNLVPGDINATFDIFVHDTQTGVTKRVSVDSNGVQANAYSYLPSISGDGRYIAFHSNATNLVPDDTNAAPDIFVYDIQTAMTTRVSVDSNGVQANDFSNGLYISANGHYIAFDSAATNLVPGDTNLQMDVFVHRQDILPIPPTPTPTFTLTYTPTNTPTNTPTATFTPTFTPTYTNTPTPTNTPTISPTPVTSCNQITPGTLVMFGNSMSMTITNPLTLPIQIQDVFVVWNHDKGHMQGGDKTLQLNSVSLGGQLWNGTSNGPSITITPSTTTYIPTGTSTITFTFHQLYDNFDGSEEILIHLATNGCQAYPIHSTSIATNTPTYTPTNTFTPTSTPPYSYNPLYLSLTSNQTIGGVVSADEDILRFDGSTWSLFFDGSDVGVGGSDLFGFSFLDADSLLLSFTTTLTLNGISVTPQDVVRFDATSVGSITAGTFSIYFDGSDVGLDTTAEKIDSVSLLPDGRMLLSTTGNPAVVGVTGAKDEDILAFTPTTLGNTTSGTWSMYFDGSDVGLGETSGEDVDALDVTANGNIYLSTADNFTVNGVSGADEDVFVCVPTSLGDVTACSYSPSLYFDGSTWNLSANDVDAFHFLSTAPIPTNTPSHTPTITPSPTFTPTRTNTPPTSKFVQIVQPNGGEVLVVGSTYRITWNSTSDIDTVTLGYKSCDSCLDWIATGIPNVGYYDWNVSVGNTINTQFKIYILGYDTGVGSWSDVSDNNFTVLRPTATPTITHTPTATLTSTPTNTYTPTIIPTITSTPGVLDLIFADGFESGNLSGWTSSTVDLGDLSASAASALIGNQGMQAVLDDNNTIYVTDDSPNAEPRYRARFYFDPNALTMASGEAHYIFKGFLGTSTEVLRMEFRQSAGLYQLRISLLDDGTIWTNSNWFTISDASHFIELDWRASTAVGANNGALTFWIDGILQADLTGVDNDTRRIDRARLGALTGVDNGTRGTYYFDAFESRRQNYIGP